jgi:hypothetical protein
MLPPGFAVNASTGAVSGQTVVPGIYTFTIQALDADGKIARRTQTIQIFDNPTITLDLPDGVNGVPYSGQVTGSNGSAPYTYTLVAGPSWMMVDSGTGAITGTPDATGTAITVTIRVEGDIGGSAQILDAINVT